MPNKRHGGTLSRQGIHNYTCGENQTCERFYCGGFISARYHYYLYACPCHTRLALLFSPRLTFPSCPYMCCVPANVSSDVQACGKEREGVCECSPARAYVCGPKETPTWTLPWTVRKKAQPGLLVALYALLWNPLCCGWNEG